MIRGLTAAAFAVAMIACGSTLREIDGQAGAGGKATATPNVPTASPAPTIGRPAGAAAPGYVRLTDDLGGWSIDMPMGWFELPGAQHGREIRSYDPTIPLPGNRSSSFLPPTGGVYVHLRMQQNPEQHAAAAFFAPAASTPGFEVREHRSLTLAGQPAEFWSTWRSQPAEAQRLEPTLSWYVRSPFFNDRMVVITAAPGESPLRPEVERIVASLQFYQPAPVDLTPTMSRREAIERAAPSTRAGKPSNYTRVEAKLVLYKHWESAMSGGQSFTTDPDTLVWVVAYSGTGITTRRGDVCAWGVSVFAARPLEPANGVGAFACGNDVWPKGFEQLVDLDK
jgi:hypothetical protein